MQMNQNLLKGVIVAFAMRIGMSHPAIALPWQPGTDFALPS